MWTVKSIKAKRFVSHLDSTITIKQGVATMIYGANYDDDAQESNGSGKSAVPEMLAVLITGEPLREVRLIETIMDGHKDAELEGEFYNEQEKISLNIYRKIKSPSELIVKVNGKIPKQTAVSVDEGNKFILELLDITKEDLFNYFIISKHNYQPFFTTGDAGKKKAIARFSNADVVDGTEPLMKSDIEELEKEIEGVKIAITERQAKISTYQEQIDASDEMLIALQRTERIKILKVQNDEWQLSKSNAEMQLVELEETKKQAEGVLERYKKIDWDKTVNDFIVEKKECGNTLEQKQKKRYEYENFKRELTQALLDEIECPNCHHKFTLGDNEMDINEAKATLPEIEKDLKELEQEISELIEQLDFKRQHVKNSEEERDAHNENVSNVKQTYRDTLSNIDAVGNAIRRHIQELAANNNTIIALENEKGTNNTKTLQAKIKTLSKECQDADIQLKEAEDLRAAVLEWKENFKQFKTHLANQTVKSIESYTNYYLNKIKTNLSVQIEGYRVLASGKLKENISVQVIRNGFQAAPFERFSAGEKVRIEICCILALQKLINLNNKSGGLDMLFLDEIIESVDSVGVYELMNALNSINQTVVVITHANHDGSWDNVIKVEKRNNYSKIIN